MTKEQLIENFNDIIAGGTDWVHYDECNDYSWNRVKGSIIYAMLLMTGFMTQRGVKKNHAINSIPTVIMHLCRAYDLYHNKPRINEGAIDQDNPMDISDSTLKAVTDEIQKCKLDGDGCGTIVSVLDEPAYMLTEVFRMMKDNWLHFNLEDSNIVECGDIEPIPRTVVLLLVAWTRLWEMDKKETGKKSNQQYIIASDQECNNDGSCDDCDPGPDQEDEDEHKPFDDMCAECCPDYDMDRIENMSQKEIVDYIEDRTREIAYGNGYHLQGIELKKTHLVNTDQDTHGDPTEEEMEEIAKQMSELENGRKPLNQTGTFTAKEFGFGLRVLQRVLNNDTAGANKLIEEYHK